ncbi:MAG: 1-acyl-sn-glycerol-3-phosphate acyltransferase [Flavobacteriales bacterium]|nr:1-acyl-sn-glycerol-3-phosphate acyltransferase [Flavobacteriales bacterium]
MKDILLAPVYFIYKLWIGLVFWTSLMLLYIPFRILLSKTVWYEKAFQLKRIWSGFIQKAIFCPVRSELCSPLPIGPFIIASNHSSHLDTVFLYRVMPRYFAFVGKGELLKWPLFRLFFRTSDIPVDRENSVRAYQSLQKAYAILDEGRCIAIYPEGTIPASSPKMKAFKKGAFRMAVEKNIPIVPITWQTNYKIMNDPEKLFSPSLPHAVRVVIHAPIFPKGSEEQDLVALRDEVFRVIDSALPEQYRKKDIQQSNEL